MKENSIKKQAFSDTKVNMLIRRYSESSLIIILLLHRY